MFFKRVALIAVLGLLVMASCGRRVAQFDFDFDLEHDIEQALIDEFGFDEEVYVIHRDGGNVVFNETVAFGQLDEIEWDDFDIDPSDVTFNLSEDGLTFSVIGTDDGEMVEVTGEFTEGGSSIEVETSEGVGR